jgi:hypothetical protein
MKQFRGHIEPTGNDDYDDDDDDFATMELGHLLTCSSSVALKSL